MVVKFKRTSIYFRMGFGISKQVTISERQKAKFRASAIVFSRSDAENVLKSENAGTYLLYRDYETDNLYLSMRSSSFVEHHRINFEDNLYYMDNQPYPYLDSIILYHQRHKLNGIRLTHHAHLSARTVKAFTTKVMQQNGNLMDPPSEEFRDEFNEESNIRILSVEHTNDAFVGKTRISKSSGRLWISGHMQQSLKRMSSPVPEVHQELLANTYDERMTRSFLDNGNALSSADSFSDLNGDMFNNAATQKRADESQKRNNDDINFIDIEDNDDNDDNDDDALYYDTHL